MQWKDEAGRMRTTDIRYGSSGSSGERSGGLFRAAKEFLLAVVYVVAFIHAFFKEFYSGSRIQKKMRKGEDKHPWEIYLGDALTDPDVKPVTVFVDSGFHMKLHSKNKNAWRILIQSVVSLDEDETS